MPAGDHADITDAMHVQGGISVPTEVLELIENSDIVTFAFVGKSGMLGRASFDVTAAHKEITDFIGNCR
jgi:predicted amidohydrolase